MAGALGGDHDAVNTLGRNDLLEMNVEAVTEGNDVTLFKMRQNLSSKDISLMLVGQQDHDHISLLGSVSYGHGFETVFLGEIVVRSAGTLGNNDIDAGITQVLSMGMPLTAVTDNGHGFVFQQAQICIFLIINFHKVSLLIFFATLGRNFLNYINMRKNPGRGHTSPTRCIA